MTLSKEERDTWMNAIVVFAKGIQEINMDEHCRFIPAMLREKAGIYGYKPTNVQVVRENVNALIKSSDNKSNDAGAMAWCFLKSCKRGKNDIDFELQHKMVDFLARTDFAIYVTTKEKLKLINFLGYKFNTDKYKLLYSKLGDLNFSQNKEELSEEKTLTVKVFHLLLDNLRETKERKSRKNKLISANRFLEAVANNVDILQDATYDEEKDVEVFNEETLSTKIKKVKTGRVLSISLEDRKELFKYMQNLKISFSENCMDYFSAIQDTANIDLHLRILSNKIANTDDDNKLSVWVKSFASISKKFENSGAIDGEDVKKYADCLFKHANLVENSRGRETTLLVNLLDKSIQKDNKQGKKLVLDVAQTYADTSKKFSGNFHEQMTSVFQSVVAYNDYSISDVNNLCDVLDIRSDPKMLDMAKSVRKEHAEYHPAEASFVAWKRGGGHSF